MTDTYRLAPDQRRNAPNCGPTSIAVLARVSLSDSMSAIRRITNKPANWRGSTKNRRWVAGAGEQWFKAVKGGDLFKGLAHFGLNPTIDADLNDRLHGVTVEKAVRALPTDKAYLIVSGGHAQAVVDGRVFDQSTAVEGDDPRTFWGRRKKIFLVLTVDKLAATKRRTVKLKLTLKAKEA